MRLEVRREEQQPGRTSATRQEELEASLRQQRDEVQRQRDELEADKAVREHERQQLAERSAVLEGAVAQLRQAQEALGCGGREAAATPLPTWMQKSRPRRNRPSSRGPGRPSSRTRINGSKPSARPCGGGRAGLGPGGTGPRVSPGASLRSGPKSWVARQKTLAEQVQQLATQAAALDERRQELERAHQQRDEQLAGQRQEIENQATELQRQRTELAGAARQPGSITPNASRQRDGPPPPSERPWLSNAPRRSHRSKKRWRRRPRRVPRTRRLGGPPWICNSSCPSWSCGRARPWNG